MLNPLMLIFNIFQKLVKNTLTHTARNDKISLAVLHTVRINNPTNSIAPVVTRPVNTSQSGLILWGSLSLLSLLPGMTLNYIVTAPDHQGKGPRSHLAHPRLTIYPENKSCCQVDRHSALCYAVIATRQMGNVSSDGRNQKFESVSGTLW